MQRKNRGTLATLCLGVLTACTAGANAQSWLPLQYQNDFVNHGRFSLTTGVLDTGGSRALLKRGSGVCINRLESDDTWTLEADIAAPEPGIDFGLQGCIDDDIAIVTAPGWVDDEGVELVCRRSAPSLHEPSFSHAPKPEATRPAMTPLSSRASIIVRKAPNASVH